MDIREFDRSHFMDPERRDEAYGWRKALLRTMADFDTKKKRLRKGVEYDAPIGGQRAEGPRKCTHCKLPTTFTTPRGRSVHPTCEGWVDELSRRGVAELIYAVSTVLPVKSVEVIPNE